MYVCTSFLLHICGYIYIYSKLGMLLLLIQISLLCRCSLVLINILIITIASRETAFEWANYLCVVYAFESHIPKESRLFISFSNASFLVSFLFHFLNRSYLLYSYSIHGTLWTEKKTHIIIHEPIYWCIHI